MENQKKKKNERKKVNKNSILSATNPYHAKT